MKGFSWTHEPVGIVEVQVKERYQMVVPARDMGVEMVVADFKFPELKAEFSGAVDQFTHPRRQQVHVWNILASLHLELRATTLQQMAREMMSFMGELVGMRGGDGFRMVLVVDVVKLDRDDNIDVIEYGRSDGEDNEGGEVIDDDENDGDGQ